MLVDRVSAWTMDRSQTFYDRKVELEAQYDRVNDGRIDLSCSDILMLIRLLRTHTRPPILRVLPQPNKTEAPLRNTKLILFIDTPGPPTVRSD